MNCVSVEAVIVSAVMNGGMARCTVQDLALMMHDQSIHPPNALRLLRLANAVRCELCLAVSVSCAKKYFGINVCWECLKKDKTKLVKMSDYGDRYKEKMKCLASYDRISKNLNVTGSLFLETMIFKNGSSTKKIAMTFRTTTSLSSSLSGTTKSDFTCGEDVCLS